MHPERLCAETRIGRADRLTDRRAAQQIAYDQCRVIGGAHQNGGTPVDLDDRHFVNLAALRQRVMRRRSSPASPARLPRAFERERCHGGRQFREAVLLGDHPDIRGRLGRRAVAQVVRGLPVHPRGLARPRRHHAGQHLQQPFSIRRKRKARIGDQPVE